MTRAISTASNKKAIDLNAFYSLWLEWITDRAQTTQQGYKVTIKNYISWQLENGNKQPTREDIIAYREYLISPHISNKTGKQITFTADTAARYFRGVKMFYSFLEAQDLYKDITRYIRSPKSRSNTFKRDALTREDVIKILNSIDRRTEAGARNYAIVLLCVSCALRIIELQRANIEDIEHYAGQYRLYIQGKGHTSKDDYKKLEPEIILALSDYLEKRGDYTKESPLFAAIASNAKQGGGRLCEPTISRIIKQVMINAGYNSKRITAHSLRHTSVTLDRIAGATQEEASKHARHSSIVITQRYDHALEKAAAVDERRILDYIFGNEPDNITTPKAQALQILDNLEAEKIPEALELLKKLK